MENSKSERSPLDSHHEHLHEHSIRHLSGIYVRNFTPFPRRDRVASLPLPSYLQRQDGHGTDDIDIGLFRKRGRRVSTASVGTFRSQKSEDAYSELTENDHTIRSHAPIRPRPSVHVRSPSFASSIRARSSSNAPSFLEPYAESSALTSLGTAPSQRILEEIVSSRLVETFITLSVLPVSNEKDTRRVPESDSIKSPRESLDIPRSPSPRRTVPRGSSSASPSRIISKASTNRTRAPDRLRSVSIHDPIVESQSAPSTSLQFPSTSSPSLSMTDSLSPDTQDIPFFMSSFHRPSTNPSWTTLDPENDFAPHTDLRMSKVHATLWGQKQQFFHSKSMSPNGSKGKEREDSLPCPSWQKLVEWDVDFSQLQPLAPDFLSTSEELPPNTIVFGLSTTKSLYYVPQPDQTDTRPPSPQQNVSDGELDVKAGTSRSLRNPRAIMQIETQRESAVEMKARPGASWENISRLFSMQKVLAETLDSLREVVTSVDYLVAIDGPLGKIRQCEELHDKIEDFREQTCLIGGQRAEVRRAIDVRKKSLNERKSGLQIARRIHAEDVSAVEDCENLCAQERTRLNSIQATLQTRRGALVRSLDRIFPVEPISSADLLFSILDVALPIPVNSSDPAPPLSDPKWPNISDESIATALGYTAQVVQLLAVYMGYLIPYPITYAGSRSLIRDPISTMHGPRMFPLYSKGVDTYRFEYAVFLLNKDIEMLMAERNLQALDMRHTLPNLKNLLLTLTNDADEEEEPMRRPSVSTSSTLDSFDSPKSNKTATLHNGDASSHSPLPSNPTTPTMSSLALPSSGATFNANASNTPTPRKAFFSPIADLWLSRRPSSIANTNTASAPTTLPDVPERNLDSDETEGPGNVVSAGELVVPASQEVLTSDEDTNNDVSSEQEQLTLTPNGMTGEPHGTNPDTGPDPDIIAPADNVASEDIVQVQVEPTAKEGSWLTKNSVGLTLGKHFVGNGILFGHGHGHEKEKVKKRIPASSRTKAAKTGTTTTKKEDATTTPRLNLS